MSSILHQLLQVRLTLIDPKTGVADKDEKNKPIEINGGFVEKFDLELESYGFKGVCSLFPMSFEDEVISSFLLFMQKQPVKIDIFIQQKLNIHDEDKGQQLLLTGFLMEDQPLSLVMGDFSTNNEFTAPHVSYFKSKVDFTFCDPMAYWLKQIGVREIFQKKAYAKVIAKLVKPFMDKNLFNLVVDTKLEIFEKTERRLVISATEGEGSLYDYLLFLLRTYSAHLRLDYAGMQSTPKFPKNRRKPGDEVEIDWTKFKMPIYYIEAVDKKPEGEKSKDNKSPEINLYDWKALSTCHLKTENKTQTQYQTVNTNSDLSGVYPKKQEKGFCIDNLPISSAVEADAKKLSEGLIELKLQQQKPTFRLMTSFKSLPFFATDLFPLASIAFEIPKCDKKGNVKDLFFFGGKKARLMYAKFSMQSCIFHSQDMLEDICFKRLKHIGGQELSSTYQGIFQDESIVYQSLPEAKSLQDYIETEGVVVLSSESSKSEEKSDKRDKTYLYKVDENASNAVVGKILDTLKSKEPCYWVKIPEFKDDKNKGNEIVQVAMKPNFDHAQFHMPIKEGTKLRLRCYPEHVEIAEVLGLELGKWPIKKTGQTEEFRFGAAQEMRLSATSDGTGKKDQKLALGLQTEGGEKFITFESNKITLSAKG
tara:strand:- start:325 stop:2268 length:1944 start_codon:yes stop_codon:yes gene_type:complete